MDSMSYTERAKYLEEVIETNSLADKPFSFFIDVVSSFNDDEEIDFYNRYLRYDLFLILKQFTNISPNKRIELPYYCLPMVNDLIKINIGFSLNGYRVNDNNVSLYKNLLTSNYYLLRKMDEEFKEDKDKNKTSKDVVKINDPSLMDIYSYDHYKESVLNMLRSFGVFYTAHYFYLLYRFKSWH